MRKAMILLVVLEVAGSLWAADPLIGTWKLNAAKSKFPPTEVALKEVPDVYRELEEGLVEITSRGIRTDGSPISLKATFPRQGGVTREQQENAPDGISYEGISYLITVIDPYNFLLTILQNGKQVQVYQCNISQDGKIERDLLKGIDAKGKPYEGIYVWDRQ